MANRHPSNAGKLTQEQRAAGGRKSQGRTPAWLRELAQERTEAAIQTLEQIMLGKKQPSRSRVAAAEALLNRGWGQPKQPIELTTGAQAERIAALEAALAGEMGIDEAIAFAMRPDEAAGGSVGRELESGGTGGAGE